MAKAEKSYPSHVCKRLDALSDGYLTTAGWVVDLIARWVERHGGSIAHERPAKGGARFVVRWPARAR